MSRINPISKVRADQLKEYERLKRDWWKTNKVCCVCGQSATELHHSRGRSGRFLNLVKYWKPLCFMCHRKCHDYPEWGRMMKLLPPKGQWLTEEK